MIVFLSFLKKELSSLDLKIALSSLLDVEIASMTTFERRDMYVNWGGYMRTSTMTSIEDLIINIVIKRPTKTCMDILDQAIAYMPYVEEDGKRFIMVLRTVTN